MELEGTCDGTKIENGTEMSLGWKLRGSWKNLSETKILNRTWAVTVLVGRMKLNGTWYGKMLLEGT